MKIKPPPDLRAKSASMKIPAFFALSTLLFAACQSSKSSLQPFHKWRIEPPAGDRYCQINPAGETIIPNGRVIKPMGNTVRIAPHPYGLALSPDGSVAVTANSGNRPFSITMLQNPASGNPIVRQVPEGALNDPNLLEDVFMGLAITPDNRSVWVAGGISNKIFRYDLRTGAKLDSILCSPAVALAKEGSPTSAKATADKSGTRALVALGVCNPRAPGLGCAGSM